MKLVLLMRKLHLNWSGLLYFIGHCVQWNLKCRMFKHVNLAKSESDLVDIFTQKIVNIWTPISPLDSKMTIVNVGLQMRVAREFSTTLLTLEGDIFNFQFSDKKVSNFEGFVASHRATCTRFWMRNKKIRAMENKIASFPKNIGNKPERVSLLYEPFDASWEPSLR